ncbi:hypothetical protein ACQUFY_24730 (plasmid) [Robbsia andropogonis]|uniref:hypothetical protein n=1 Tax=Robbsia andropogonis TaxID=28092 RepID=UPI003D1DA9F9
MKQSRIDRLSSIGAALSTYVFAGLFCVLALMFALVSYASAAEGDFNLAIVFGLIGGIFFCFGIGQAISYRHDEAMRRKMDARSSLQTQPQDIDRLKSRKVNVRLVVGTLIAAVFLTGLQIAGVNILPKHRISSKDQAVIDSFARSVSKQSNQKWGLQPHEAN